MLSGPTPLASAEQAFGYFLHEYLARNDPEHRTANRWHGRGAAVLGLPQRVGKRRFMGVLAGHVPGTAIRLGRIVEGEHQHRPGWDATFSAPKSVSLEALLYGNKPVLRAHDAAVRATLDWVEAEFLQTRGWEPGSGRRPRVKADGLVAATFRHVASRNNDPQLHTHTVIANMTRNLEGEWRSVEPTLLRRRRRLIGAWYRNELARRLVEMGYVLVPTEIGGLPSFELAGYGPAILEAFSTRRRDILAHMAEKGWDYTAAGAQRATLHTRKRKEEPGRPELAAMWKRRAETLGLSRDGEAVRLDRQERRFMQAPPRFSALEAVWQAVDHMEERHSVFASADLLAAALGRDPGRHGHEDLERAIGRLIDDNHLVETKDGALTTRRTIRAEKEIVSAMKKGRGKAAALAVRQEVRNRLDRTTLTEGQKEAVDTILLSHDRIVGVQGFAGTGKTRMLSEVAGLAGARTVFGFAPSAAASRVLAVEGGIGTTTLQWLLTRYGRIADGTAGPDEIARAREAFRDAILVVDEASMVGTVQMRDLMRIVERLGAARLVLVGDSLQLKAVDAGQPFRLLQRAGMATARMDDIIRQRSLDLKAAVTHMVEGDPELAVESLGGDVRTVPPERLAATAARLWLALTPEARAGTIILAPTHALREEIHGIVRRGLAEEGVLHGRVLEISRLVDRRLTRMHAADAQCYRPGDVAVANRDVYGCREGEAWTVTGAEADKVLLERREERVALRPSGNAAHNLALCEARPLRIQAGDAIVWTRNIRRRGLINGERATVETIARGKVRVRMTDGRKVSFATDDDDLRHIDHAWSSTVHRAQGLTTDNAIAVLDAASMMSDRSMLYVEMSRARHGFVLLTDDTEQLVARLEQEGQSVPSALEATGEAPWLRPDLAMPVAQKPSLWPVLEDWRRLVAEAGARGKEPFRMDGCEALMTRAGAHVRNGCDLPGELASAVENHAAFARDRGLVNDWVTALLDVAGERKDLETHAASLETDIHQLTGRFSGWYGKLRKVLVDGEEIAGDMVRYGPHLDLPVVGGGRLAETMRGVRRAFVFDARAVALREELAKGTEHGKVRLSDDLAHRIADLAADAAPGTMPSDLTEALARHRAGIDADARALACVAAMVNALQARTRLLMEKVPGDPHASLENYGRWKKVARSGLAEARTLLDGDTLDDSVRRRLLAPAGLLEKALRIDGTAEALDGDWKTHIERAGSQGIHAFYAPGYDGLMERSRDFEREADHPDEVPPRAVMALREHRGLVKTRDLIASWRATLERLAAEPDAPGDRWRRLATRAVAAADWITGREDICAVHMPSGSGLHDTFEAVAATVRESLGQANRAVALVRDWRRLKAEAQARDTEPYWMEGCDELMARVRSYWTDHDDLPGDLLYVLQDHSNFVEQRKTVDYWPKLLLDSAAERTSLESYAASKGCDIRQFPDRLSRWTGYARRADEYCRKILDDQAQYGRHVDAAGIDRGRLDETLDGIRRALDFDERAAGILTVLEGETEHGKYRLSDDLIQRITDLASVATPGTMPLALTDALARHQAGVEANARAHTCLAAMEKALKARAGLLKEMGIDGPVTRLRDYRRWKEAVESCHAEARALLAGGDLDDGVRRRLQEPAGLLEKTLRIDKAEALDRAWETHMEQAMSRGVHPFYLPGYNALVKRARDFQREVDNPAELPSRAAMALKEHPGLVKNRNRIDFWSVKLERLAEDDDIAGERWRRLATRSVAAAHWITGHEDICAVHMPSGSELRDTFEAAAATVGNRLRQVNLEADLLRDWRAHCEEARRLGLQDFHAPGYDAIVEKVRDLDASAGGPLSPDLSRILEDHETFTRDRDEARKRLDRVEACLRKRDRLLEDPKYEYWRERPTKSLRTLTWRHRPWRREAKRALAAARELLDEDKPWCKHLDGFEEGREGVERASARLERAGVLDRFDLSFVRQWEENVEEARNKGLHLCLVPGHDRLVRLLASTRATGKDIAEFRETEVATFNRIMKTGKKLEEASDELWRHNIPTRVLETSMEEWLRNAGVMAGNAESILKRRGRLCRVLRRPSRI